jgi:hypothetical protein
MNPMAPASKIDFQPRGLATGIGSLPFTDPQAALALIFENLPDIPHWPQLPRRGAPEHFVHQFLQPLVDCGTLTARGDTWIFDTAKADHAECLTDFYATCLPAQEGDSQCLQSFLPTVEAAAGLHAFLQQAQAGALEKAAYVKGQIVGPLTVALELKDQQGRPAYYQGDLRDIIVRTLALQARRQAAALSGFGCTPIIFIDDPAVRAYGSRLHLALSREMIIEDLDTICAAIESENALAGIHSCEAVDWSLLMRTRVRILSLDAYRCGASLRPYAAQLKDFLARGGIIAWGIVPTLDDPFAESAASLHNRLLALWHDLLAEHSERQTLLKQSLVTPACGTGLLTPAQTRRIYHLTAELSRRLRADAE